MIKKDDMIISCVERIRSIIINFSPSFFWRKRQMRNITPVGVGKDIYIILNAPSLKTQDLSVLKGKETMFVNRGFMHPMYKDLQPAYHVFVDTKMLKGIWPVSWIGDILQMSPNTKILLPLSWSNIKFFKPYEKSIYWLNWNLPFYNLGVSGSCFSFAIQQKFEHIYFTGFDATGIGHEMIKTADSHFYGNDKELENKPTAQFAIDLLMHSRHLHDLNRLALY